MEEIIKRIQEYTLEEIMSDRFSKYAKEIILDRAIPDVRDGLKPVQRRILYDMYLNHNTSDKAYIKCAATVGDVLGKFHPHGDSSVYDAMVRMSQWWKQNNILVDMHGNNGSMDGDDAAAYRYTEARLAKISNELLKDLEKNTVAWAPNFDDRFMEPTVLPAKFPNLLVNGSNGISAGYATNIPPHNLGEIINATIKRIDSPNCHLDTILDIVKGPDFPTGGIVEGINGIRDAFTTGKGKVVVRSKYRIERVKGKTQIIIDEIPFDVNKAVMVNKMDAIRIEKKIEGIAEVRDESDREGLRVVIDLKAGANTDLIVNYLMKNTDMQTTYNYNMVSIVNRRPMTLGILPILDAYIAHQKEVITKRSEFDLATFKKRLHIVEGFLKLISILDQVIKVIRASKNKADARANLVSEFGFSEEQAEAIVVLQLYRLTNTDVVALENEQADLLKYIATLEAILADEEKLKGVMKHELKKIRDEYATPRKTEVKAEITEIKIDTTDLIPKENVVVVVTNEGYVKRVSSKSFAASKDEETTLKPGDYITGLYEVNTLNNLILFTDLGNYLYIPVHKIPECKWKELGKHVSNVVMTSANEQIIGSMIFENNDDIITLFTQNGAVKRCLVKDLEVQRCSKPMIVMKLKDDDRLVSVQKDLGKSLFVSQNGYYLNINSEEIPVVGPKASGVKGINLKDDILVAGLSYKPQEYVNVFTDKKTAKRVKVSDLETMSRAKKGSLIIKKTKTVTYQVINALVTNSKDIISIKSDNEIKDYKNSDISIMDLASTGSALCKHNIEATLLKVELESFLKKNLEKEQPEEKKEEKNPQYKEMTLDDFIDGFKI